MLFWIALPVSSCGQCCCPGGFVAMADGEASVVVGYVST